MEDVIYTLLKLARLDAGIIQMEKTPENLSVLMQDVLERFETWANGSIKQLRFPVKKMLFYHAMPYGYRKPLAIL